MPQNNDLYTTTHVFMAAVRVLEYQKKAPPSIKAVCQLLSFSLEQGHFVAGQLVNLDAIALVSVAGGDRLFIKDHLALEDIPRDAETDQFEEALKKFHESRSGMEQKVATLKSEREQKKKDLFAELESKLKKKLEGQA
jgi:hypothetical protein